MLARGGWRRWRHGWRQEGRIAWTVRSRAGPKGLASPVREARRNWFRMGEMKKGAAAEAHQTGLPANVHSRPDVRIQQAECDVCTVRAGECMSEANTVGHILSECRGQPHSCDTASLQAVDGCGCLAAERSEHPAAAASLAGWRCLEVYLLPILRSRLKYSCHAV